MSFLFGKKQSVQAIAEVLEDGREIYARAMKNPKYNNYSGPEPILDIPVRVQPADGAAFEAVMKAGMTKNYLLKLGVRVQVKYDPAKLNQVTLDDDLQGIMARNSQLIKKQGE